MRFVIALILAFFATSLLFFLMVQISKPSQANVIQSKSVAIDFGSLPKEIKVDQRDRSHKKPKKLELDKLPKTEVLKENHHSQPMKPSFKMPAVTSNGDFTPGFSDLTSPYSASPGAQGSDSPQIMIQPQYPERARQNKVEGYVTLQFLINELGRPYAIEVIESAPGGYFEKAAKRAVSRWKYAAGSDHEKGTKRITLEFKLTGETGS